MLLHFLITAGPTVEDIDPVRFISNRATGTLGFETAHAALAAGHRVTLIHGPVAQSLIDGLPRGKRLTRVAVRSCADMRTAVETALKRIDVVVMTAAVADFTPLKTSATKIKKAAAGLTIRLKPTTDILQLLGQVKVRRRKSLVLIGFALETGQGRTEAARRAAQLREARRKLERKNLDAIVLDTPAAMGARAAEFRVLRADTDKAEAFRASKKVMAQRLIRLGTELMPE